MFIALLQSEETESIREALGFVGLSPKSLEGQLIEVNKFLHQTPPTPEDMLKQMSEMMQHGMSFGDKQDFEDDRDADDIFAQNAPPKKGRESNTPALDFFGVDITEEARDGKIDPIIGRDTEIERLISVLNRKTKNNPCLVGEPGVGKTAVVE